MLTIAKGYDVIPANPEKGFPAMRMNVEISGWNECIYVLAPYCPTQRQLLHASEASEAINKNILGSIYGEVLRESVGPLMARYEGDVPEGYLPVTHTIVDEFEYDHCVWRARGMQKVKLLPRSDRWMGRRDEDGWPMNTFENRDDAVKDIRETGVPQERAEQLACRFMRRDNYSDDAAVFRDGGPWSLSAHWRPSYRVGVLGGRAVEILPLMQGEYSSAVMRSVAEGKAGFRTDMIAYLDKMANAGDSEASELLRRICEEKAL